MTKDLFTKGQILFIILGGFFITNALVAEFIGVKIFSLEANLGFSPWNMTFFGQAGLGFNLTCGVILWPVVFVMTDVINEYYGIRGVKLLSNLTVGLIAFAFLVIYLAIGLEPAGFWPTSHLMSLDGAEKEAMAGQVGDYDAAYGLVLGQGLWIIIGSLVAFLIGQIVDVYIFQGIKRFTGEGKVWLRATGSTLISQFIDSFVVLFIAFYIGAQWSLVMVLAIGLVNYIYKFVVAVLLTPVIYLAHAGIDAYLGHEVAHEMKMRATGME
jgi:uncharacterized PurR-regulated membrane protein YhhQ (DUF165 family)